MTAGFVLSLSAIVVAALFEVGGSSARMVVAAAAGVSPGDAAEAARRLTAPEGFEVTLFADGLPGARLMAVTEAGDVLVSLPEQGTVMHLAADRDGDATADDVRPLIGQLGLPHGLEIADGWLIVAEESVVRRVRFDGATGQAEGDFEALIEGIPAQSGHWTRTIRRGPDGALYLTIGSSCNACIEQHEWRAAMLRLAPDAARASVFATGLRNTVGFDWQPGTGTLYGVDNGRDWLGDDFPPDELNVIIEGGFYGWPFFNADNVPDPELGASDAAPTGQQIMPVHWFGAHVAPLAIHFLRHQPDAAWNGRALVTLHGSWNRSERVGYEVVALAWRGDGTIEQTPFLSGFRDGEAVFGRPVGIAEAADGTIYISDDFAGAVYRVTPSG